MRRCGIYARVSTNEQSVDVQLEQLRAYAAARGFAVVGEFVDAGVSGTKASRPALDEMMAAAHRRDLDMVLALKLDRLARSVRHLVELGAELQALGVDMVVRDQAIDTTTPTGRLLFHVLSAIAEFERDLIVERVRAGIDRARRQGKHLGRPPSMDARAVARARRLRGFGKSIREIAKIIDAKPSTVCRALKRAS